MSEPESIIDHIHSSWREDVKNHIVLELERRGDLDEIEYGQILADTLAGCVGQFVFTCGQFWAYSPVTGLYQPISEFEIHTLLYELHKAKGHDGILHSLTNAKINKIVNIATRKLTDNKFFEDTPKGLSSNDGFLILLQNRVELKEHSACYRSRWKVSVPFSPLTDVDETASEIAKMVGGTENAQAFLETLGVALFGLGTRFGRMLVFVGEGANGKSTLVNIMCQLIPAAVRSSVPLTALKTEYDRVELDGKVLNTLEELPVLSNTDVQLVKNIITGGSIQARQIGKPAFTMNPIAQHVICTNRLPSLHENNEALRRRLVVIRLDRVIPEGERDLDFAQMFFDRHKEALVNLAISALQDALERGRLYEPNTSKREVDKWLDGSDFIRSFIRDCIEQTGNPKERVTATEMYDACVNYANQHELSPPTSPRAFGSRLEAAGFEKTKSSIMHWVAVRLRADSWEGRED